MTTTTVSRATPVPDSVILTRRIRLAAVVAKRADAEAAEAHAHLSALEAERDALAVTA